MFNISVLNTLDIIFILVLVVFGIRGIVKGAVSELTSLGILILSIVGSIFLRKPIADFISSIFKIEKIGSVNPAEIVAVLLIFICLYAFLRLIESKIHDALESVDLSNLDKAFGFFLGLLEGVCICFLVVFLLTHQLFFDVSQLISDSKFASIAIKILPNTDLYLEFFKNKAIGV
ncbi:MAG: CvpA family protein [Spirochaetales bacterium]|nr:CvpA family protein [Spirochaetales bacterium]